MIKPLPGYVLVEPIEDETKTASGLYVPENDKDKPSKGNVIAMGSEMEPVGVGSVVVYKKFVNQEVTHEGKKYLLIKFDELLAIIE